MIMFIMIIIIIIIIMLCFMQLEKLSETESLKKLSWSLSWVYFNWGLIIC